MKTISALERLSRSRNQRRYSCGSLIPQCLELPPFATRFCLALIGRGLLVLLVAHLISGPLRAQSIFDPSSQIYYSSATVGIRYILPNGHVEHSDSEYSPFTRLRSSLTNTAELTFVQLPNRTGLLSSGRTLFQLESDGSSQQIDLFADQAIPCIQINPNDQCSISSVKPFADKFVLSMQHSSLGPVTYIYDQGRWMTPTELSKQSPLTQIDDFEPFLYFGSKLLKVHDDLYLIVNNGSARLTFKTLDREGIHPLVLPFDDAELDRTYFDSIRAIKGEFLAIFRTFVSPSDYYFVHLTGSGLAIKTDLIKFEHPELLSKIGRLVGIDESGVVYGLSQQQLPQVAIKVWALDSSKATIKEVITIPSASFYSIQSQTAKTGVWLGYQRDLYFLSRGQLVDQKQVAKNLESFDLHSEGNQALDGMVVYDDQTSDLFQKGDRVPIHQSVSAVLSPAQEPYWFMNHRICGSSLGAKGVSRCFDQNSWQPSQEPDFIYIHRTRSFAFGYHVDDKAGENSLWRRDRHRAAASWQKLTSWSPNDLEATLVPSSVDDQVGLLMGDKLLVITGDHQETWSSNHIYSRPRPALSDGLLYGYCDDPGGRPGVFLCTLSQGGDLNLLTDHLAQDAGFESAGWVPLNRGALTILDRYDSKVESYIAFQDRILPLIEVFGELSEAVKGFLRFKVDIDSGLTYLVSSTTDYFKNIKTTEYFATNGQQLVYHGHSRKAPDIESQGTEYDGRPEQIWQEQPGQWQTSTTGTATLAYYSSAIAAVAAESINPEEVLAHGTSANGVVVADSLGLWFCAKSQLGHLTADTQLIMRHPGCEHFGYHLPVQQIAAASDDRWYLRSGQSLLVWDRQTKQMTTLADDVASQKFAINNQVLTYGNSRSLISLALSNGAMIAAQPLPVGIDGQGLIQVTSTSICSRENGYQTFHEGLWHKLLPECSNLIEAANDRQAALSEGQLYLCRPDHCQWQATLPVPDAQDYLLSRDGDDVLVGFYRSIYRLEASGLSRCTLRWAYGEMPKVRLKSGGTGDDGSFAIAGNGVILNPCVEPKILRR